MKQITFRGKKYKIKQSNRQNKKFKVDDNGKIIHFGARGYRISPGTSKGDNYCARSSGIKTDKNKITANILSRAMWRCKGKRSIRK